MNDLVQVFSTGIATREDVQGMKNKIQSFHNFLNESPSIDSGGSRNGNDYVVISHIEMKLDELFNGHWSTESFKYQQVANEIVGNITLRVLHPITGVWITREGAAAVQIMQDKGKPIETILQTKKKNALETCFPKLKAMCLKNAAASLGKIFGRDLNRNNQAEYLPKIVECDPITIEQLNELKEITDKNIDIERRLKSKFNELQYIPKEKFSSVIKWVKEQVDETV